MTFASSDRQGILCRSCPKNRGSYRVLLGIYGTAPYGRGCISLSTTISCVFYRIPPVRAASYLSRCAGDVLRFRFHCFPLASEPPMSSESSAIFGDASFLVRRYRPTFHAPLTIATIPTALPSTLIPGIAIAAAVRTVTATLNSYRGERRCSEPAGSPGGTAGSLCSGSWSVNAAPIPRLSAKRLFLK